MTLPAIPLPTEEYTFGSGDKLQIRGLSREEAIAIRGLTTNVKQVEIACIAAATGVTEGEAAAWIKVTPQDEVEKLVDAIIRISGLNPDSGKADAGALPSEKLTELITLLQRLSENHLPKSEPSATPR